MKRTNLYILTSLLVVIVILMMVNAFTIKETSAEGHKYIPRILFTLKYGHADDQITAGGSKIGEPSSGPSGPRTFSIDKEGNIYIADSRGRIKKFTQEGNLLMIIEGSDSLSSVAIDSQGNIYVVHGTGLNRLIIFDNTGEEVYISPKYYTRENYQVLKKIEEEMWQKMYEIPGFRKNQVDKEGRRYEFIQIEKGGFKTQVNIYEDKKEPIKIFTVPSQETKGVSAYGAPLEQSFKDIEDFGYWKVDGDGNLYGITSAEREKPIELRKGYDFTISSDRIICKYNPEGKFLTQIRYPVFPVLYPYDEPKVDQSGNIYVLIFHADRMDVVKYEWVEEEEKPTTKQLKEGTQTITKEEPKVPEVKKIKREE